MSPRGVSMERGAAARRGVVEQERDLSAVARAFKALGGRTSRAQLVGALGSSLAPTPKRSRSGDVPDTTLGLVHLRASQINGCSFCVDSDSKHAKHAGESDERLFAVAAWREAPYFTDAERAALALTETATRLSDRPDPVPDEVWEEAARHHDERGLAAIILWIATTNVFNRLNVTTSSQRAPGSISALEPEALPKVRQPGAWRVSEYLGNPSSGIDSQGAALATNWRTLGRIPGSPSNAPIRMPIGSAWRVAAE